MFERNKDVVRRLVAAFNRHDLRALDELVTEDVAWHGGSLGELEGRAAFKQLVAAFFGAFPDLRIELNELIAERDLVAARWSASGTHKGKILGVPATNRRASWSEQPIYRIVSGRIREVWWIGDAFGLLQQLGAIVKA